MRFARRPLCRGLGVDRGARASTAATTLQECSRSTGLGWASMRLRRLPLAGLLHYLRQTKQGALEHVEAVRFYERSASLELDAVSVRNLELVEPLFSGESRADDPAVHAGRLLHANGQTAATRHAAAASDGAG